MYLKRAIPIILFAFFFFLIAIPSVQAVPQSYRNLRITIKPQRPASYQGTDAEFQANPTYVQGEQANFNITFTSEVRWGWSRLRLPVYIPPERIRTTFPNPGSRVTLDHLSWGYYAYTSPVLTEVGNNNHTLNIVVYTIKRFRFFGRTYRMPVPAAVAQKSISVAVRSVDVEITSPVEGAVVNTNPLHVEGTIDDSSASIIVNQVPAVVSDNHFTAEIPVEEGENTITAVGENEYGNTDGDSINVTLDTTPPEDPAITIEQGEYTITRNITLTLHAEDVTPIQMIISENQNFSDTTWEAYSTTRLWTLSSPDGLKTIYARFMDAAGNESGIVSDTVVLDTTVPELSITNPVNNSYTNVTQIDVSGTFTEINLDAITVNTIQADTQENTFTAQNIQLTEGTNTITVVVTDLAGNTAQGTVIIILDTVPPQNPGININEGAYTNTATINLTLSAEGADEMAVSEDPAFSGSQWAAYTNTRAYTLTTGDGNKPVYAKYRDLAGNETETISDSIILDTTPPQIQINSPEDNLILEQLEIDVSGTFTESNIGTVIVNGIPAVIEGNTFSAGNVPLANEGDNPILTLATDLAQNQGSHEINIIRETAISMNPGIIIDEGDNTNIGIIHLTLYADGATEVALSENQYLNRAVWEPYSESKVWVLSSGNGPKTVYARFKDTYGNLSEIVQDSVTLNQEGPYITIEDGEYSNRSVVRVILHAEGVTEVMLSENPDFSGASWEPYEETKLFTLSSEGGRKVIYAQFR